MQATVTTLHNQHDRTTQNEAREGVRLQVEGIVAAYHANDLTQLHTETVGLTHWVDELRKLNKSVFAAQAIILTRQYTDGKITADEYQGELALMLLNANGTR